MFEVASSDLVNMGITVVSYTLKDIRDEEVSVSVSVQPVGLACRSRSCMVVLVKLCIQQREGDHIHFFQLLLNIILRCSYFLFLLYGLISLKHFLIVRSI